jgi:hypothetical protein
MPLLSTAHRAPLRYVSTPVRLAGGSSGSASVAGRPAATRARDSRNAEPDDVRTYSVRVLVE